MDKNTVIMDVTKETKAKTQKLNKKGKSKPKTTNIQGGDIMDRTSIEVLVKEEAKKAGLAVNQGVAKATSAKPAPIQVRNNNREVILAVRAGELLFHMPHEEVVKVGKPHGGGWPHCTKVFYGTITDKALRPAVKRVFKEKNTVAYWKAEYKSVGRTTSTKKAVDPKAQLKALKEQEKVLKREIAAATKANAKVKKTDKKATSKKGKAIAAVAKATV